MADDIDIDEHDVLDNPLIKNIFPDLTVIKKEVSYEYHEESPAVNKSNENDKIEDFSNPNENFTPFLKFVPSYKGYTNCKNLGSDVKMSSEYNTRECVDKINIELSNINEITMELKPEKLINAQDSDDSNISNPKIVLIDLAPYLYNCKKYCEMCFILFPNEEDFEIHKKSFHYLNVVHEILKSNSDETQHLTKSKSNTIKCSICEKPFLSISGLYRHKKKKHFVKDKIFTRYPSNKNKIGENNIPKRNNTKVSVNSSHHCFHCNASFLNMQSLIEHLYETLLTKKHKILDNSNNTEKKTANCNLENLDLSIKSTFHQKQENIEVIDKKNVSVSYPMLSVYRCPICSFYHSSSKYGLKHLLHNHKLKNIKDGLKKVVFDPKCKFCFTVFRNIQKYNSHIRKVHKIQYTIHSASLQTKSTTLTSSVNKTIQVKNYDNLSAKKELILQEVHKNDLTMVLSTKEDFCQSILKSALFRCNRCEIHFLHSKVATDHTNHLEILINWKCSLCNRIFKKNDEFLHMQQHLETDDFAVHGICDTLPSVILYKCLKCSVHFEENIFLQHYTVCGTVIQKKHIKCKLCDILIDYRLKFTHADHHEKNIVGSKSYIIVQSEVINTQKVTPKNNLRNMVIRNKKRFKVYYCNTCNCFINNGRRFSMHEKGNCVNVPPIYCTLCGLVVSKTGISTHRRIHKKNKKLTLQNFIFHDMKSNKLIHPPMPDFPQCKVCGLHFSNFKMKLTHECGMDMYITCTDCNKNYSLLGYELHMYYHNYRMDNHNNKLKQIPKRKKINGVKKLSKSSKLETNNEETESFIYVCKDCDISVTTYDSMVEHCQEHYNPGKIQPLTKWCEECEVMFSDECYQNHISIHKQNIKMCTKVIKFDIYFFMSKYGEWIKKVFDSLTEEQMRDIVNKSIYKYENKIKMQVIQEGHYDTTLYKCDQCKSFIIPFSVFNHFDSQCLKLRKHYCRICEIPFISVTHKIKHEAIHEQIKDFKSFRIVLFNRNEDKVLNECLRFENWCTLLQCRNCEGVVDKSDCKNHFCNRENLRKCTYCGLLLYPKEYDLHILKHKEFDSFNSKKIIVILIGNKTEDEDKKNYLDNNMVSSFNGKVIDYIYYKCKKCQICMKDFRYTLKHNCSFKIPTTKCDLCGLYFEARKLKSHYSLHENDNNFIIDNITLTDFDHTESENTYNPIVQISETNSIIEDSEMNEVSHSEGFNNKSINENEDAEKVITLYKCNCGLHFLEYVSLMTHRNACTPKTRITRVECSKCSLTFSTNVLFTHLLKHHGNKNKVFKFEVIDA